MQEWEKFEHLVARIHQVLDGKQFSVEQDVKLTEPTGGIHQIDVVLRPASPFLGRILVSCKSSADPVGVDHVREWADIVEHTGAAAGVIVSPTGFTSGAIGLAKNPARRLSLWIARPLREEDFAPDEESSHGYLRSLGVTMLAHMSRPRNETFRLDVEPASGKREGREVTVTFSQQTRDRFYLRDEQDNVVGNLWDDYLVAAKAVRETGVAKVAPTEPRFLVVEGRHVRLNSLSVEIEVQVFEMKFDIDTMRDTYGYENAVTGEVKFVPLNQI